MGDMTTEGVVHHCPQGCRFTLSENGKQCVLEYQVLPGNTIDFHHTYVPFRLRGRGHAERLVKVALNWAQAESLLVKASCWYVANYMKTAGYE